MFNTTLVAWRLVVDSSIGLIEELFGKGFNVVLTGRFNQDTFEKIKHYSAGPLIEPPDQRTIPVKEPKWFYRVSSAPQSVH
uniref:Uncharacterized protein n=1 Tax=Daphnia galeata TaxID=27404 RepID=A0A8J2RKH7_9CRUS|nr:unnamed protein product [Daphnia galeata]